MESHGIQWPWIKKDITPLPVLFQSSWLYQEESLCWMLVCFWMLTSLPVLGCDGLLTTENPTQNVLSDCSSLEREREELWPVCSAGSGGPHSWADSSSSRGWGSSRPCSLSPLLAPVDIQRKRRILFQGPPKEKIFFFPKPPRNLPPHVSSDWLTRPFSE